MWRRTRISHYQRVSDAREGGRKKTDKTHAGTGLAIFEVGGAALALIGSLDILMCSMSVFSIDIMDLFLVCSSRKVVDKRR